MTAKIYRSNTDGEMATVDVTQEQAAVLNAIAQVCAMTGFGRVTVEIRDGKVRLVEIRGVAKSWVKRIEKHEPSSQGSAACATDGD